jgi:carboxylesterase type B
LDSYRVGFFGFAASSALRDEDNLNAGLLDQRLGLQWVHDHIAAFGGDPDNVTIFGENVGWTNAQLQLTAYGGVQAPLFHRAILQSGPTLSGDALTAGLSDNHTTALAQLLNCTSAPDDSSAELKCLRSVPLGTLVGAAVDFSLAFSPLAGIGTWRPTAPSSFVPDAPSKLLQAGRFHRHVDILVGWNEDDGTQFVLPTLSGTPGFAAFIQYLFPGLSPANNQQLLALYPESDFSDMPSEHIDRNFFRAAQVVRDAHFACPSLRVVEAWKQHAPARKTYLYSLNQTVFRVGHAEYNKSYVGQDHFSDIPYVFDYVDVPPYSTVADQTDYDMASQMSGSWAAFANFGQPTVPGLSAQQLAARNLTFAPWDPAFGRCGNLDTVALRVLGGPRDGMASIPWSGKADRAATVYDEKLAERCGFWDREDVLAQTWM